MSEARPIDLDPLPRSRGRRLRHDVRRVAAWAHLLFAVAIVLAVFAQVYLIGAYIFGAGEEALNAHKTMGWTAHGFEAIVFIAALLAWLPPSDISLSFLLFAIGSAQVALASKTGWVGGLHPLLALVVLGLATALGLRGVRRLRRGANADAAPDHPAVRVV